MSQPVNPYLRTKVLTASPEELRLMLYDGALKFCRQAKVAIEQKQLEDSYQNLVRAQKIVLELSTSLKHSVEPELCGKLSALYTFIYRKLVDANIQRDTAAIDEAVKLLEYERETWVMLMEKISGHAAAAPAEPAGRPPEAPAAAPAPAAAAPARPAVPAMRPTLGTIRPQNPYNVAGTYAPPLRKLA